jgi:uncharacterized radical SAM superfamily Fe-S cluster-containing enzyme
VGKAVKDNMRIKQSENFVVRQLGEETVLVPINQTGVAVQKVFALNAIAADIFDKLSKAQTIDELIIHLNKEYAEEESVIRLDVGNIIDEFLLAGIIEKV